MMRAISLTRLTTRLLFLVPFAALFYTASTANAQPALGSAQSFAVLGASTVTNTGATLVTGDLGVSPGTAITCFSPGMVVGTIHAGDLVAAQAHSDAVLAYARLKGLACLPSNNLTGKVLGTSPGVLSLPPGVYCFDTSAQLTGALALTGAGHWVFQVGTTLTTESASQVLVVDAGQKCSGSNVFWQVGSSATLGTGTRFAGNILALASITVTTGVSVSGSVMALTGEVTMDTNHVSVCSSGSGGLPPYLDKCEDHNGKDAYDHDKDKDRQNQDKGKDKDKDKDKDHQNQDKDKGKDNDHEGNDRKRG